MAKTDAQTIRELRRLGGLLKHHFGMVKATELTEVTAQMSRTLESIQEAIEAMSNLLTQKDEDGFEKNLYSFGLNFVARTASAWKQEMIALSQETIHSKMPVTHWVMSWQENEAPTRKQVRQAVGIFLERMGLKAHQTIVAAHINTANFHVHIAVNWVHPLTEKVVQPHKGFDIEAAHRIVAEIEHKQGWASNQHARYWVNERGHIVRKQQRKVTKPKAEAEDFENATGEKSAQRMAQEKGHAVILRAASWHELHAGLAEVGMRFVRKGSGAVIYVGETPVKASSVDRSFALGRLCKRLGEFEESLCLSVVPPPEPEPVSHVCAKEWHEYQAQRRQLAEERHLEHERCTENRQREKEAQQQERQAVLARMAPHGLPLLNIARHFLLLQQQSQKTEKKKKQAKVRHSLPCFKHWLAQKNHRLGQLWRLRNRITPDMQIKEFRFHQQCRLKSPLYAFQAMVQAKYADTRMEQSRLDSATALYLRCAGYTMDAVDLELFRHTPCSFTNTELRDSLERRTRILQYAYGTAGDIDIAASRPTPEKVQRFIAEAEQKEQELRSALEQQKRLRTGDPVAAYRAHSANLRQHLPKADQSTLDRMIALRMRTNGHSREIIFRTLVACSPTAPKSTSGREQVQRAERIAEYAFCLQGTHDMMKNKSYWPMWRKIEGVVEVQPQREEQACGEERQRKETRPMRRMR